MPPYLPPHKSSAHRATSIALYRALLSQCRLRRSAVVPTTVSEPDHQRTTALQNAVRNRFRKHRVETSHRKLSDAFAAGYEALDLLTTAYSTSSAPPAISARTRLTHLLTHLPPAFTTPLPAQPSTKTNPKLPPLRQRTQGGLLTSPQPPDSVLARPRAAVSGRRRVPYVVSAGGYPMLRVGKPQPAQLGAYIRRKIRRRERWLGRQRWLAGEWLRWGEGEDEWDRVLGEVFAQGELRGGKGKEVGERRGRRLEEEGGGSWCWAIWEGWRDIAGRLERETRNGLELWRRLEGVVEWEKALAGREGEVRRLRGQLERDARREMEVSRGVEGDGRRRDMKEDREV